MAIGGWILGRRFTPIHSDGFLPSLDSFFPFHFGLVTEGIKIRNGLTQKAPVPYFASVEYRRTGYLMS